MNPVFPYSYGSAEGQNLLLDLMWGVWPHLPSYGRKAAQFVDLLGYFSLKCTAFKEKVQHSVEQLCFSSSHITLTAASKCIYFAASSMVSLLLAQ